MQNKHHGQALDILRTVRLLQAHMGRRLHEASQERLLCGELTLRQMNTLMVIHERVEVKVKELAEALNVSPPSASAMVERLVELGMVTREPSVEDRREVRVRLSDTGHAFTRELEKHFIAGVTELMERVGPDVAAQWHAVYTRLREVMCEQSEPVHEMPNAEKLS